MKKALFAIAVATTVFASNAKAQFSVGVGYANEFITSKESSVLPESLEGNAWQKERTNLSGFYVEGSYNWVFASVGPGKFALQPGVRYYCMSNLETNGRVNVKYEMEGTVSHTTRRNKTRISNHFIDIPVNVKYSYDFVPGALKGYVFAGPSFSLGLAANSVETTKVNESVDDKTIKGKSIERVNAYTGKFYYKIFDPQTDETKIEKGKNDEYKSYNMFDLKLAIGIGITVAEKVDIKFGYNIGLLNRSFIKNTADIKYSTHSNVLHFGAAYNF